MKNWQITSVQKSAKPLWVECPDCGEFWCNLHQMHTGECDCPEIDEMDFDPYEAGNQ